MKRSRTEYPGVYYRTARRLGAKGTEKIYYITFKKNGRMMEEKVGRQYVDDMTPAKASRIRGERIEGKRPSEKEKAAAQKWTFSGLWEAYIQDHNGAVNFSDKSRFKKYIASTIGSKRPEDLRPLDVDRIRLNNLLGKSDGTLYAVLALIGRIASFGQSKQMSAGLSFQIKKPKLNNKKTECLTQEQLARLLTVLEENPGDVAASLKMALFTGMRRNEIFKLEWADVDFDRGFILLRNPKGGTDQTIPLNSEARKVIEGQPKDREKIFGNRYIQRNYEIAIKLKEKAELPKDFRIYHGLRHTFASLLASSGKVDLYVLQKLLTHKNPQQTQRYAHLRDESLKRGSQVMGDIVAQAFNPKKEQLKVVSIER